MVIRTVTPSIGSPGSAGWVQGGCHVTVPVRESARKRELLDAAYAYVAEHGMVDMSLRPLADAVGSSPRVLLFLFGSKDQLIQALLARAREDELASLQQIDISSAGGVSGTALRVWRWLSSPGHRRLLMLWAEGYARSLIDPAGPWAGFARQTVDDWLDILAAAQPPAQRRTRAGATERTLALSVLRGSLLDLLATGDERRVTAAVRSYFSDT
jgi:AcrR family transcriptional regulator